MQTTASQILSGTLQVTRERIAGLSGMWLTYFAMQIVFSLVAFMGMGASFAAAGFAGDPDLAASMGGGTILFMLVFYAAYLYLYAAQSVSMGALASPLVEPRFGEAFTLGFKRGFSLLGAFVLLAIAGFVGSIILGLAAAVISFLGPIGGVLSIVGLIAIMVYLSCRLLILPLVVAVDDVGNPKTAITRSWRLTGGNVLPIFLAVLVYAIFAIVLFLVPFALFYGSIAGLEGGSADDALAAISGMFGMLALFAVVGVVVSVIGSALIAVVHAGVTDVQTAALEESFS